MSTGMHIAEQSIGGMFYLAFSSSGLAEEPLTSELNVVTQTRKKTGKNRAHVTQVNWMISR